MRQPVFARILLALIAALLIGDRALADPPASNQVLTSLKPAFFVLTEGSNADAGSAMSLGVASEIGKAMKPMLGAGPWVIPQPDWKQPDLIKQCSDPMALGGVIVTFYTGAASHFYLVFQSETQTFAVSAELIACTHPPAGGASTPTIVGVIAELPGAHGTPWVVRRSQVSIPLISVAGAAALLSSKTGGSSSKTVKSSTTTSNTTSNNNLTTAAVIGSLFTQASNRDIPGYSTPLKLRYGSQHVGVDLVRAFRDLCTTHADLGPGANAQPRDALCTSMGFTLDPTKVGEQQQALDAFEAAERHGPAP